MRWYVKAAAAQLLSRAPGGRALHHFVQRNVTRTLPLPEVDFATRLRAALQHLDHAGRDGGTALDSCTFLEFGAGWDLAIPLVYAAAGVPRQVLFDLDPLARADLVSISLDRVQRAAPESGGRLDAGRLPATGPASQGRLRAWLETLGIRYVAPGDARATGLAAGEVNVVTSTATLEHIPSPDIARILAESHRVLKPGGIVSCQVDMSDHFSHSDSSITPWHFLRFGERAWRLIDPPMLYHNRLRASAHVALARAAGFEIAKALSECPTGCDVAREPLPRVHPDYRGFVDR
ncbi:MAG: class I SAM-dependent methyltransferase, partial [Gemmatimonadaceae bacterium]